MGELNLFGQDNKDEDAQVGSNSYRHRQIYKLKHYLLSDITGKGNNQFFNQIRNIEGQFDRRDALRQDEFQNNEESSITIPLINTSRAQLGKFYYKEVSNTESQTKSSQPFD